MSNEELTTNPTDVEERIYQALEEAGLGKDLEDSYLKGQIRILATEPTKESRIYTSARKYLFEYIGSKGGEMAEDMASCMRVGQLRAKIERILGEAK